MLLICGSFCRKIFPILGKPSASSLLVHLLKIIIITFDNDRPDWPISESGLRSHIWSVIEICSDLVLALMRMSLVGILVRISGSFHCVTSPRRRKRIRTKMESGVDLENVEIGNHCKFPPTSKYCRVMKEMIRLTYY